MVGRLAILSVFAWSVKSNKSIAKGLLHGTLWYQPVYYYIFMDHTVPDKAQSKFTLKPLFSVPTS